MELFGICLLTLIPVRKEPSDRSEMISQIIFGETFYILEEQGVWSRIKTHFDQYEGWVATKMIATLSKEIYLLSDTKKHVILKEPLCRLTQPDTKIPATFIPGGSTLNEDKDHFTIIDYQLFFEKKPDVYFNDSGRNITDSALKYLNTPYLWGGRTIFGVDCSGFTQIVFKMNGISLPRDAYQQAQSGQIVDTIAESKPGDLAFFTNDLGNIIHTGIILENSKIIHASGQVRIDLINHDGIFNENENKYTHKLFVIKRIE